MITVARRVFRILLVTLPLVAMFAAAAPAGAAAAKVCAPVRATGIGQDLGMNDEGQLQTTAKVYVDHVQVATSNATFTPSGPPVGTTLDFSGPIVLTSALDPSTLTANVQGSVDLSSGKFAAASTSVTGTGLLAGVSGHLRFRGIENLTTGAFTESIRGRLCARIG